VFCRGLLIQPAPQSSPVDRSDAARVVWPLLAGALLATLFELLGSLVPGGPTRPSAEILVQHIREFDMADTSWVRHVYLAVLALLLGLVALTLLLPSWARKLEAWRPALGRAATALFLWALIAFGVALQTTSPAVMALYAVGSLGVALTMRFLPRRALPSGRRLSLLVGAITAAILLVLVVPGLLRPPVLKSAANVVTVDAHYAGVLGPAIELALRTPLDQLRLNYGMLPLTAAWVLPRGTLQFSDVFSAVQLVQLVFLGLLYLAIARYDRSRHLLLWLLTAILVAPFLSTLYRSVYYPNQSGLRYFDFLAFLLLLRLVRPGAGAGFGLGAAGACLVFGNPETGIAVCLGLAFRQIVVGWSGQGIRAAASWLASFLAGLGAGLALLYWLVFEIAGIRPENFSPYIFRFTSGYGGLRFTPDPWSFLMILIGAAVLLQAAARAASGVLTEAQGRRAAIAATLLVWLPYFVNRPDPWNLWTMVMLLLFVLADWLTLRHWRATVERFRRGRLTLAAAAVIGIATPFALQNAIDMAAVLFRPPPPATSFSGVRLPAEIRAALVEKSDSLRTLAAAHKLVHLSLVSALVALDTGVSPGLLAGNVFADTIGEADLRRDAAEIEARNPDLVLFDAPTDRLSLQFPDRAALIGRIKPLLSDAYRLDRVEGGWEIWIRREPAPPGVNRS
jgi:hypothetical protein